MLVLYRIDDRLLHGQVLEGWVPETQANFIVVVNDELAQDHERQRIVTLTLSAQIGVLFLKTREALTRLKEIDEDSKSKAIAIFAGPQELLQLLNSGLRCPKKVNVGGLHYAVGRLTLGRFMTLSLEDKEALRRLLDLGIQLDARSTPRDEPVDIEAQLREEV